MCTPQTMHNDALSSRNMYYKRRRGAGVCLKTRQVGQGGGIDGKSHEKKHRV